MKTAVFSVDPGAMGLAGDGAGWVVPAPCITFQMETGFWRKREVSVTG